MIAPKWAMWWWKTLNSAWGWPLLAVSVVAWILVIRGVGVLLAPVLPSQRQVVTFTGITAIVSALAPAWALSLGLRRLYHWKRGEAVAPRELTVGVFIGESMIVFGIAILLAFVLSLFVDYAPVSTKEPMDTYEVPDRYLR